MFTQHRTTRFQLRTDGRQVGIQPSQVEDLPASQKGTGICLHTLCCQALEHSFQTLVCFTKHQSGRKKWVFQRLWISKSGEGLQSSAFSICRSIDSDIGGPTFCGGIRACVRKKDRAHLCLTGISVCLIYICFIESRLLSLAFKASPPTPPRPPQVLSMWFWPQATMSKTYFPHPPHSHLSAQSLSGLYLKTRVSKHLHRWPMEEAQLEGEGKRVPPLNTSLQHLTFPWNLPGLSSWSDGRQEKVVKARFRETERQALPPPVPGSLP